MTILIIVLIFLILLASFFSGAETSMIALNRYRLRNLARKKNRAAQRAQKLLAQPDRMLGVVLIGNTCANIIASAVATIIAEHYFGEASIPIVMGILTFAVLVFAEVTPKTLAAIYPERLAFPATIPLLILLKLFYPLVWLVNAFSNRLLKLFGVNVAAHKHEHLNLEELRTLVYEAGGKIPAGHKQMLLQLLDLEHVCVEDIMIPRAVVVGIDLSDPWDEIMQQLAHTQYTRIPVYQNDMSEIRGLLHARQIMHLIAQEKFTKETLSTVLQTPYYIPEGTLLNVALLNFRRNKVRTGFVVNEYGEFIGLITLEDILEEIVGEFTTDSAAQYKDIYPQVDGTYLVNGSVTMRELNRNMNWHFKLAGPKTLSGQIIEYLQTIPEPGISLRLDGYPIEIVQMQDNKVKTARIFPELYEADTEKEL